MLPFYIGNILACFVIGSRKRASVRGHVNTILYRPIIAHFIKKIFGEKLRTIKFVRQHTPSRFVCVVNDKYFVKVFKNMSHRDLKNFEFFVNYIGKFINVNIPKVYVPNNNHMYFTKKIPGYSIYDFDKEFVLKHETKILNQIEEIINQLQSVDVKKIPNPERFCVALETISKKTIPEKISEQSTIAHFDLNVRNVLFDKNLNICGLIDFDGLCITNDKTRDKQIFMKYWNRYKEKK